MSIEGAILGFYGAIKICEEHGHNWRKVAEIVESKTRTLRPKAGKMTDSKNDDEAPDPPKEWELFLSFWIDTDGYTDRDREMFVAGFEFSMIVCLMEDRLEEFSMTFHRENQSRVRMAARKFGRVVDIEDCDLIRQLTAEELSGVDIYNENPDKHLNGLPDCLIQYHYWDMRDHVEDFRADTLLDCLLQAMATRGLTEEPGPDFEPTPEQVKTWGERHDLAGGLAESDWRAAASDIRSIEFAE